MSDTDIAVVGLSLRVPGARTPAQFWANLSAGIESTSRLSEADLRDAGVPDHLIQNPDYVPVCAELDGIEWFDAQFFGFNGREAAVMDPQHRIFLEAGWHALEDAGYDPFRYEGSIGVFAGSGHNAYLAYNLLGNDELMESMGFFLVRHTGNDKDFLTTRLSYCLDLKGPSVNVQTACSTSLVAVHLASQSLLAGECDIAIAGGVTIGLPHGRGYLYLPNEILSRDGHCSAFDADSSGTIFGSGAALVVLKRLQDAIDDGDNIRAVIKGSAVNNDGANKAGYLAPSVDGQAQAIIEALEVANVDPRTVGYVEAHGTGTQIGDPIEVAALTLAYGSSSGERQHCGLGSVKTNIGHLDTAAGTASLIKAVLALENRQLPPSLNFRRPNDEIDFSNSPFYVNTELRTWESVNGPRRAGVSSLGVGGTNAHVILEEAPTRTGSQPSRRRVHPVMLTAKNQQSLQAMADNLIEHLQSRPDQHLADVTFTLATSRARFGEQLGLIVSDADQLPMILDDAAHPQRIASVRRLQRPRVVFAFSGQGSQYPGMGSTLYETEPTYRAAFDECCRVADKYLDYSLKDLILGEMTEEQSRFIAQISVSQPALFAVGFSLAKLWESWGIVPDAVLGHSSGQITAATYAGTFTLEQGMRLIIERGALMQTAAPGRMLAVMLNDQELQRYLTPELDIAAINAPGMAVVSGSPTDIDRLEEKLRKAEISCSQIKTSHAGHSQSLEPILDRFEAAVRQADPQINRIPLVSNLSGRYITDRDVVDPSYWRRHLRHTVRFQDCINTLLREGETIAIEVGPGSALMQLAVLSPEVTKDHIFINSISGPKREVADDVAIVTALARTWMSGRDVDWRAFYEDAPRQKVGLPGYAFSRQRHWFDPPVKRDRSPARSRDTSDWLYTVDWEQFEFEPKKEFSFNGLIVADQAEMLARVATLPVFQGFLSVRSRDSEALEQALKQLEESDRHVEIYYFPESSGDPLSSFRTYLQLIQRIGDVEGPVALKVVTTGLVQISERDALTPEAALICGPVWCARSELGMAATVVDVLPHRMESPEFLQDLSEINCDEILVAWRDGFMRRAFRPGRAPRPEPFPQGSVVLVTGGAEGLGLHAARALARLGARLALIGRTRLPPESDWQMWLDQHDRADPISERISAIIELREQSPAVGYWSADVAEITSLQAAVEEVREQLGEIRGVVHAAGVLNDGPLLTKDIDDALQTLRPKVTGIDNLVNLAGQRCEFVVGYSSISALTGVPGQCDYVSANAFLDSYLRHVSTSRGIRCVSLNWAAWSDIGMTTRLVDAKPGVQSFPRHPLGAVPLAANSDVRAGVVSVSADSHWVLDEHRARDQTPLLPGTAFLEMTRVNFDPLAAYRSVVFRDVLVLSPLSLRDGETREVRIEFLQAANRQEFVISSCADAQSPDTWYAHVRGRVELTDVQPARHDLELLRRQMRKVVREHPNEQGSFLQFGDRWSCIRSLSLGKSSALLELELPERFKPFDECFLSHPALLDVATAGVLRLVPGYTPETDFYVPISYATVTFHGRMGTHWFSHINYRTEDSVPGDVVAFDVLILDADGVELARFDEFMLKNVQSYTKVTESSPPATTRVKPAITDTPAVPNERLRSRLERWGIKPDDVGQLLPALLTADGTIVVSPQPIAEALQELVEVQATPAGNRQRTDQVVDLAKVNEVLRNAPGVLDAVATSKLDRFGDIKLAGFVVLKGGAAVTTSETRRFARSRLPDELAPSVILELDALPRRRDGEIDFGNLPNPFDAVEDYVAPSTQTETMLVEIWQDILGIERVSVSDNFFDLGGHSLLAVRVIAAIKKRTGNRIADVLLLTSTLEQIAANIDSQTTQPSSPSKGIGRLIQAFKGS